MHAATASNKVSKITSIIALYRRCIRSVQRMPDASQRASYLAYVRDGFRRRAHLHPNSREAILAYNDGLDQVESMEYYHSQIALKTEQVPPAPSQMIIPSNTEKKDIAQWLLHHLPHLSQEDTTNYSQQLISDGFDSVDFIKQELLAEDLSFMKKAHRRVIERHLRDPCDAK